jgi:hypothetical protein
MMVVVGLVAIMVVLGIQARAWIRKSLEYRRKAAEFGLVEQKIGQGVLSLKGVVKSEVSSPDGPTKALLEDWLRHYTEWAEHFRLLRLKYERAAMTPWEPLPPDPATPTRPDISETLDRPGVFTPIRLPVPGHPMSWLPGRPVAMT